MIWLFFFREMKRDRVRLIVWTAAIAFMTAVIGELEKGGTFRIADCAAKDNIPSIRTHIACGFNEVSQAGTDYLYGDTNDRCFGFEYRYRV